MRKMIALILLLAFSVVANAQMKKEVDEFTGKASYSGEWYTATHNGGTHQAEMMAHVSEAGRKLILVTIVAKGWVHLNDNTANALLGVDKTRTPIELELVQREVFGGGSTFEAFKLITTNQKYENPMRVRIGSVIYEIPEAVVNDLSKHRN